MGTLYQPGIVKDEDMKVHYETGVAKVLREAMGLRPKESVVILSDRPTEAEKEHKSAAELRVWSDVCTCAEVFCQTAGKLFPDNEIKLCYFQNEEDKEERNRVILENCAKADLVLAISNLSISHLGIAGKLLAHARVASMPQFRLEMLEPGGPCDVDYQEMQRLGRHVETALKAANRVQITSELGSNLTLCIHGREVVNGTATIRNRGEFGNVPIGEVFTSPQEGSAEGTLVVPAGWYPGLTETMTLTFHHGEVTDLSGGGETGDYFRELLGFCGTKTEEGVPHRRNCAELGIGMNAHAHSVETVLEAEKILGSIHVAIGDNSGFGGVVKSDIHVDFVIPEPTVFFDGGLWMQRGKRIEEERPC